MPWRRAIAGAGCARKATSSAPFSGSGGGMVTVWAGGQASRADIADHRALGHALAGLDVRKARHVPVQGGVAAAVVEDHHVAVAALDR
ncbi:hypothetical protein G6F68_021304 [Rhizopus microsporus]|nr:hypothetical protein G6F68_021304 [Rhizopus microsporus]